MQKNWLIFLFIFSLICFGIEYFSEIMNLVITLSDRKYVENFIKSYGVYAPLVFIAVQIFQVIFAPVPGELTGFIGGYLFGMYSGFFYSSLGLAAGSSINFAIGRFFGSFCIQDLLSKKEFIKYDQLIREKGIPALFCLYVFPGFPKDYLCIFVGLTSIPFKLFFFIAAIGRMPGTFFLSIQGDYLFKEAYEVLFITMGVCLPFILIFFLFRKKIFSCFFKKNSDIST